MDPILLLAAFFIGGYLLFGAFIIWICGGRC